MVVAVWYLPPLTSHAKMGAIGSTYEPAPKLNANSAHSIYIHMNCFGRGARSQ